MSGRRFHDGKPEIMLGDLLAENLKKKVGDTLEIQGTPFTVAGIYHGGSALEAGAVIMPLDQIAGDWAACKERLRRFMCACGRRRPVNRRNTI